jgi:hypothetical protein
MSKPILGFRTQKDCRAAVRSEVDPHRSSGVEFYSPLVRELLSRHHWGCLSIGVSPIKFRWGLHPIYGTRDCFTALFEDSRYPDLSWRKVSYNKAISRFVLDDSTLNGEMKSQLRWVIKPIMDSYRDAHLTCEKCGHQSEEVLRVDHVYPEFEDIADDAISLLDDEERRRIISSFDWSKNLALDIPHKVISRVLKLHESVKLMAVHYHCHVANHRDRRHV